MLIIKFALKESKYTWFVNENWIMIISFLLTMGTAIILRKTKNSKNGTIKMPNPRSGAFIDDCINTDFAYEIVDPGLEIVIRRMLKLNSGPIVISTPLLIPFFS